MNIKNTLLTAAVGGILAGVTGCAGGGTPKANAPDAPAASSMPAGEPAAAPAKGSCSGMNSAPAAAPEKHSCTGMKSGGDAPAPAN